MSATTETGAAPWLALAFVVALLSVASSIGGMSDHRVPYSELVAEVRAGHVTAVEVRDDRIVADLSTPRDGAARITATRLPGEADEILLDELDRRGTPTTGVRPAAFGWAVLGLLAPMVLFLLAVRWFAQGGSPAMKLGSRRAPIHDRRGEQVTFADVAGVDEAEAELVEVVRFLREPERYKALGARIPKGVLLVGPPGTGKTLLAKAVAGEAGVPFFSLSGSEFVELFVGVGASRIRDLFAQARERAPCIVFIDELDAIGKARGGAASLSVNDEREQTLDQLLVEMDGFDPGNGVVLMAATNRPDILDPALVRPGRFDRQVVVDRPDIHGREDILRVHLRKLTVGDGVDPHVIAARTPGMAGADLANLVNEAALAAARRGASKVEPADFEEAVDRLQLGLKKKGRVMTDAEKRRVAYHEAGHALVAMSVEYADPVHRVSIIPRSIGALGVTVQLPTAEHWLVTRRELADRIAVMLGGRAAEELVWDDVSSGAEDDLVRATETARLMVTRLGMSARVGAVAWRRADEGWAALERPYGDETARLVDQEIRAIVEEARIRARKALDARRPALDAIAARLLVVETLDHDELDALVKPARAAAPAPRSSAAR